MNDNTILTDKELDDVVDVLKENRPTEADALADVDTTPKEDIEGTAAVVLDMNGNPLPIVSEDICTDMKDNTTLSIDQVDNGELEDINSESFEKAINNTSKNMDIPDEEAMALFNLIIRYKKGEKFNIYESMPKQMKDMINQLYAQTGGKASRSGIAKTVLENFISEANIEKEFIDFQKTMEQTLNIPSIIDMYSEHIKDVMETKTLEMADNIEAEYPEKSKLLREVSTMFTTTYQFDSLIEFMHSDRKARNHITKDVKNYNKFCSDFNFFNESSQFKINDVGMLLPVLSKLLTDVEQDDIIKFIILFCKKCEPMNHKDVVDCTYMYYFIKNITMLEFASEDKTVFSVNLIANIRSTIALIKEAEAAHNEEVHKNDRKRK